MKKNILVTGGAGYIGSHFIELLLRDFGQEYQCIVFDNLSKGHREALGPEVIFVEGGLEDKGKIAEVFEKFEIDCVVHFAAFIEAGESMEKPGKYFRNNSFNTLNLLDVMAEKGCKKIIFSSTAAVYGEPEKIPIDEEHPKKPTNYYGLSKLMVENFLEAYGRAHGLNYVILRYFNAAGADPGGKIGQDYKPLTHLIPIILEVPLGLRKEIKVFGTDYPTPDGTCIRDYIHVTDLAQAHILALQHLEKNNGSNVFNLGSGEGYSVREVIEMARRVTGREIKVVEADRRPGDPARLVASSEKIKEELGWKPRFGLREIMETAWEWQKNHLKGYR